MLNILNGGRKYTSKELANKIEVSPRQIRDYVEELEKAGIYIESVKGRHGGYYYKSSDYDYKIRFDLKEINILEKIYLLLSKDNENKKLTEELNLILEKMRYIVLYSNDNEIFVNEIEKKNLYNILSNSIKENIDVMLYVKKRKQRRFLPHSIYINNGNYYVTGYCYDVQDIRTFPFSEILQINILK